MPVPVAQEFLPNGYDNRPPLRQKYLDAGAAVDKMVYEGFREKGLAFILPLHDIAETAEVLHFSPLSWTSKKGKRQAATSTMTVMGVGQGSR